jgi:hypothetical protein
VKDEGEGDQDVQAERDAIVAGRDLTFVTHYYVPPAHLDASISGGQGVQAGSGNVQNNTWATKAPLDPAALSHLNPYAAVARLQPLSYDDLVDFFVTAEPADVAEMLTAFLETDEAKVVAVLGYINRRKATKLIESPLANAAWLAKLPEAGEAIARKAASQKWGHEKGTGRLERAARSPQGSDGYFRQYTQGRVYWCLHGSTSNICAVDEAIAEIHLAKGDTGGELGFPKDEERAWKSPLGTAGTWQPFQGGYIASSSHGTYSVSMEFWKADPEGALGWAVSASETGDRGQSWQRFEGGVMWSSEAGTFTVRSEVAAKSAGSWIPIAAEEDVPSHPTARVQRFQGSGGGEIAVYSSEATGVQWVSGRTLALYGKLGGPGSWLGFPAAAQVHYPSGRIQSFEHGSIYLGPGHGATAIAVPAETVEVAGDRLGWPECPEKSVGGSGDETIQFFEKGAVILRDGKREILVRPAEPASPLVTKRQEKVDDPFAEVVVQDLRPPRQK